MIPKIIHYCWFGGEEKPSKIQKCMNTWSEHLSDYELVEWNEENFDLNTNSYVREAYNSKKYAFVSDFVRVHALYHYGGIYLDTDVEVMKSFDDLLNHKSFWGFEQANYVATSTIGAEKNNELISCFLNYYTKRNFINQDGGRDELTNVAILNGILEQNGLKANGEYQEIKGIGVIYPQHYFSPFDYINLRNLKNEESYTLHHFYKSWLPLSVRIRSFIKVVLSKAIGGENIYRLRELFFK
ncbi:glycosyltransferase family 32 protein [Pseudalkalibacillus hwajinpoensis]|uniref:glycosyltransferase family 32 protein n=1 Tax=Guptibacillus hwajinpoensis TaxID=208199 RepID=UPI001CFC6283|nr:glycosyltransferase [Pseudalkalibacillus hwajinpoensis]